MEPNRVPTERFADMITLKIMHVVHISLKVVFINYEQLQNSHLSFYILSF